jgi:hypothetical protein
MAQTAEPQRTTLHLALMLGIVLFNSWLQVTLGDLIADNGGLGEDGWLYAEMVRDLPGKLQEKVPFERLQRILPSAMVWASFQVLGVEPTDHNIIQAYRELNAVCLAGCVLVWHLIAGCLGLGRAGRWFGFVALFVNFAFGKWTWFYPVLTDAPTYLVGFLLCWTFLRRWLLGMALVTLVGSFVCSTLNVWSLPLFLFLGAAPPRPSSPAYAWHVRRLTGAFVEICVAGTLISYFGLGYRPLYTPTDFVLFPFSLLGCAAYVWWGFGPLVAWEPFVQSWKLLWSLSVRGLLVWLAVNVAIKAICEWIQPGGSADTATGIFNFVLVGGNSFLVRAAVAPLVFLVTHTMFFGPMVLVLALRWQSVCRLLSERGPGLLLFTGLLVLLALDSESRHFYIAVPFLVAFAARDIEQLQPRRAFWWVFIGFSVLWSTTWLALYNLWMLLRYGEPTVVPASFYAEYLNVGPWFWQVAYHLHREILIVALIALVWALRPTRHAKPGTSRGIKRDRSHSSEAIAL